MTVDDKINEIESDVRAKAKRVSAWDYHATYLNASCAEVKIDGLWMEFGVYRGRSITHIAGHTKNTVYGFDSFEGLPEHWDKDNPLGVYSLNGQIPSGAIAGSNHDNPGMYDPSPTVTTQPWPANVKLIKGWFNVSVPPFIEEHKEPVAYMHIDSDIYSSCKTVLTLFKNQIVKGTVLDFDELLDYPDYKNHEIKAFAEFLLETGHNYEALVYQDLGAGYTQACVRIV